LTADYHPPSWWGSTPDERASGQAEALPFGSLADPVSQLASLAAPGLLKGGKAVLGSLGAPGMAPPPAGYGLLSDIRGSTGMPRSRPPKPNIEEYTHWRYGEPPASGFSRNARDGLNEAGVSAYPMDHTSIPTDAYARSIGSFNDRPLYLLKGRPVGTGADGEPVLEVVKSIKAPPDFHVQTPFGPVEQIGTPAQELRKVAAAWGAELPANARYFQVYDADGNLAVSWYAGKTLHQTKYGRYDWQGKSSPCSRPPRRHPELRELHRRGLRGAQPQL
jgi:hypothetical protein